MKRKVKFTVNNEHVNLEVEENTPLLWVLREHLNLTGTRYGCGKGLCGACTVHLDGTAVRSCQLPVESLDQANITTIENIAIKEVHPVQQAWMSENVPQCGYCQNGQIMSAIALLDKNPHPTDAQINNAMKGNLCRCGTYLRIKKAIKLAAKNMG